MINFSEPFITDLEQKYINKAVSNRFISGDGPFTQKCTSFLEKLTHTPKALLTPSCTAALEMAALLINIRPGDEVIMPSFTFTSTANAFLLRGATLIFVDICQKTLCIDPNKIEAAITAKTRAIVPVHYAGAACEMDTVMRIAHKNKLYVIEDAAQSIHATYKGKALGTIGDIGCMSFHATKNIICGEGGALFVNNTSMFDRADIIREKGTNRKQFLRGQIDKYTWQDIGSSYLPSDITAAFLLAQLEQSSTITQRRLDIWNTYHAAFTQLLPNTSIQIPHILNECKHNGHIYYLLLPTEEARNNFIDQMKTAGIQCTFHYGPLHSSGVGQKHGRTSGSLIHTNNIATHLVRLPLHNNLNDEQVNSIINNAQRIILSMK